MKNRTDLLKEIGWTDELIQHFLVDDSDLFEQRPDDLSPNVFDTNTYTVVCNAVTSGNQMIVTGHKQESRSR